jgi:hypothetical protein
MMMNIKTKEHAAAGSYQPPVCEEFPLWSEGPLCDSNEKVGQDDGEWLTGFLSL